MKNKKGISLIVLVITIVVIIILAGAVILGLVDNNVINKASEAKFKTDSDTFKSELALYVDSQYMENIGEFNADTLNANTTTNPSITEIVKSMDGNKINNILYSDIFSIQKGELVMNGSISNENIILWTQNMLINKEEIITVNSSSNLWQFNATTKTISKYLGTDIKTLTKIVIPNSIDGIPVENIIGDTNQYNSIFGDMAGVTLLKELVISGGIKTIGEISFGRGSSLTSVTLPNTLATIGVNAFYGCTGLTNISIPNSVTSIGLFAFNKCSSLSSINVASGNGVYSSNNGILYNKNLTALVTYPANKTASTFEIPNSVTKLENYAFFGCSNLASITIPNTVTNIVDFVFLECSSLTNIEVSSDNANYCSVNGILFNKGKTAMIKYPQAKPESSYVIPNDVTSLEVCSFEGATKLSSISIPNTMKNILDSAFYGCSGLTSIVIPDSVINFGLYVFDSNSKLATVTIGNGLTTIGEGAFYGCTSLANIIIPNSIKTISNGAFYECSSLKNLIIPDSVTTIGPWVFESSGLTNLTMSNNIQSIGIYAFYGCKSLTSLTLPNSLTSLADCVFENCSGLTNITMGTGLKILPHDTFRGCSSLTNITMPNGVITIADRVFNNCGNLPSILIPSSVTSISSNSFAGCGKLLSMSISKANGSIAGSPWGATAATVTWTM